MNIRKMLVEDIQNCSEILEKEYSQPPYNEHFQPKSAFRYIESKFSKNIDTSFVLENHGKILGFCISSLSHWSNGPQAIIEEIVINSNFQGQGFGKELYFYVENYLKNQGVKSLMLWAQNNSNAFHFHQKNGYFPSDEHTIMFKNL